MTALFAPQSKVYFLTLIWTLGPCRGRGPGSQDQPPHRVQQCTVGKSVVWAADPPSLGFWAAARVKSCWGTFPRLIPKSTTSASILPTGSFQILDPPQSLKKKSHRGHLGYGFQTIHRRRNQKSLATAWGHTTSARVYSPVSVIPILLYLACESHRLGAYKTLLVPSMMPVFYSN